jgi:hypothetical protein
MLEYDQGSYPIKLLDWGRTERYREMETIVEDDGNKSICEKILALDYLMLILEKAKRAFSALSQMSLSCVSLSVLYTAYVHVQKV